MPKRALAACLAVGPMLVTTAAASAAEELSGDQLKQYCEAFVEERESPDAAFCIGFIHGFLGATNIAEQMAADRTTSRNARADESLVDRATRTRLGESHLRRARAWRSKDYCIGEEISTVDIVETITPYIERQPGGSELTASEIVRRALVHHFPCDS